MKSFKKFLISEAYNRQTIETEAVLVLRKIIDMVDDGHVDYDDKKISINIGHLIHDKRYNNLDLFIVKSKNDSIQIGRHSQDEKHGIFIHTEKLPQRENIDDFLSDQVKTNGFKQAFVKFVNDADLSSTDEMDDSTVEQTNKLNTREQFETVYKNIVNELDKVFSQYLAAKKDIYKRMENSSEDMGEKEILKSSALRLRNEMLGKSFSDFKHKCIEIMGSDKYKMLNKEFKQKLESRLTNFYENKVK